MKKTDDNPVRCKSVLFFNLITALTAAVLSIAAGELVLHVFVPGPETPRAFAHQLSTNPILIYEPSPSAVVMQAFEMADGGTLDIEHRINRDGFRDRNYDENKISGAEHRIAFLGDSVVYGYELQHDQTIPKQLEQMWAKQPRRIEVLNFGVSGYDTEQQIEFLKSKALLFHPDTVILGYTLNDSRYASWELDILRNNWHAMMKTKSRSVTQTLLQNAFRHSRILWLLDKHLLIRKKIEILQGGKILFDYMAEKYEASRDSDDSDYRRLRTAIIAEGEKIGSSEAELNYFLEGTGLNYQSPIYASHWNVTEASFEKLRGLSDEHGFKVIIVIWPLMHAMDHYALGPLHDFLNERLNRFGFSVIDLKDYCRDLITEHGRSQITWDGIHFTPMGAYLAAEYLREAIKPLLPDRATD